ncbi:hypothetical protein [Microbacterium sp. CR_7]|uniref:hypothetical protein n=1 Tax=Microbacterium sp. CR_7 TaxID=3055792 RepID=UPI0035C1EA0A
MNEPQVWTLIGVFAAGMCGTITLVVTMFAHIMKTEFASVRNEFSSEFASVRTEIASVRTEMALGFEAVRTEFRAVHGRIDALDRDVNAIYRHLFGIDRG